MTHVQNQNAEVTEDTQRTQSVENSLTGAVMGAAIEVQRVSGAGLPESAYAAALSMELQECRLAFARELPVSACLQEAVFGSRFPGRFCG